jgi:hypothetical protein
LSGIAGSITAAVLAPDAGSSGALARALVHAPRCAG